MKKIKDFILKNYSKIMFVLLIVVVITVLNGNNSIFGAINPDANERNSVLALIQESISFILGAASGVGVSFIAYIILAVELVIFILLATVFGTAGLGMGLPFPDDLIFNRVAFFDPNFINPTTVSNAPIKLMQGVIQNLYFSMFTIATAIFVIAAMVIGIKLAISSIAEEKAQYKKSLTNWIMGIVLLFSVHILMAGIFKLNETIVHTASNSAKNVTFPLDFVSAIPLGSGKVLRSILNGVSEFFTGEGTSLGTVPVSGYAGLLLTILFRAIGGDLIYTLILGALIGQTVALIVSYAKRLFYCIFLGVMAPLIVAMDTIKKSIS